jgi:uncharacterized protein (DUF1697 family)
VLCKQIAEQIQQTFGFKVHILLLRLTQFEHAAVNNPFYEAQSKSKTLYVFFLAENTPHSNLGALTALCSVNNQQLFTRHIRTIFHSLIVNHQVKKWHFMQVKWLCYG